jgi:hypothetical protein
MGDTMSSAHPMHLTPDDLDALLFGTEEARVHVHLETCPECRRLVVADRNIVLALESLPQFSPGDGFAERVMARVSVPVAAPVRVRHPAALARAAVVAVVALGGLAASVAWSLANQVMLLGWRDRIFGWVAGLLDLGVAGLARELSRLSWYAPIHEAIGSPARLALILTGATFAWLAGLLALRRLTALPTTGRASHAG